MIAPTVLLLLLAASLLLASTIEIARVMREKETDVSQRSKVKNVKRLPKYKQLQRWSDRIYRRGFLVWNSGKLGTYRNPGRNRRSG